VYAGAAKALPFLVEGGSTAAETAQQVFNARNQLKVVFRLGLAQHWHMYTWEQVTAKYGNDTARIIAGATRTNPMVNTVGATGLAGGTVNLSSWGFHE